MTTLSHKHAEEAEAVSALVGLTHEIRLKILRLLIEAGPEGKSAGSIAEIVGEASAPGFSYHLHQLERAGLVLSQRKGRFIIYTAVYPAIADLMGFLVNDCCSQHPEIMKPLQREIRMRTHS